MRSSLIDDIDGADRPGRCGWPPSAGRHAAADFSAEVLSLP